ncbi:MAG: enolase C-terminal domain-like protein [Myxococcota bacterium]
MRPVVIDSVVSRALSVPTAEPFVIATGEVHATRSVLAKVVLEDLGDGRRSQGLGEGSCFPPVTREDQPEALAGLERAVPLLVGSKVTSLLQLQSLLDGVLGDLPVARAALEVACLDALARLDAAPLYQWLEGDDGAASPLETDVTIPLLPPERMAALAAEWWARGFRALKVKVGKHLEDDLKALGAMVKATPQARFRPDANGGLSVEEALAWLAAARTLGAHVDCFEQPCATRAELEEVARRTDVPVIADESVKQASDLEGLSVDGVNLKIAKSGSLLRARDVGLLARTRGLKVMVGGMVETRLGMTAAAHLAASLGGADFADLDTAFLLTSDPFHGGYVATGAQLALPDAPGLGISFG